MRLPKKTLAAGLAAAMALAGVMVHHFEGTRYHAYQDIGGVWTICEGHTRGVHAGETATAAQCVAWRKDDLRIANRAIDECIHVPLTTGQHAALLDGVYNLGPQLVCGSTLQRKANAGRPWCRQLLRWDHAGGREVAGLTTRRKAEVATCEGAAP